MTNTEPQGIKDIREAKANYLDALANLRAADAAVRNADAEYRKAETELKQAEAAIAEAAAKAAEIAVELEDAAVQAKIAEIKAQAEIDAVKAQKKLAKAQAALDSTLRNLAATSLELTGEEQTVISNYTEAYKTYIEAEGTVREKQQALWEATNQWDDEGKKPVKRSLEETKASYEKEIAQAEAQIAKHQAKLEEYSAVAESERAKYDVWKAEYDAYADSVKDMQYETEKIRKERAYYQVETNEAFEAFVAYVKKADDKVTTAVNKAATQEFGMNFTGDKAFALPTQKVNNGVVDKFAGYVNNSINGNERNKITVAEDKKKMSVVFAKQDSAKAAIFGTDVATEYSLAGIIDALKRDSVIVETFIKDTTGLAKKVAEAENLYKKKLDTLKNMKLMGYPKVTESIKAYNDAIADSTAKKNALDAALNNLRSAVDTLRAVYTDVKGESFNEKQIARLTSDVNENLEEAIRNFASARYDYFGTAADSLDYIDLITSVKRDGTPVYTKTAITALTSTVFTPAYDNVEINYYTDIDTVTFTTSLGAREHIYDVVLSTLLPWADSNDKLHKSSKKYASTDDLPKEDFYFSELIYKNGKVIDSKAYKYKVTDATKKKSNYFAVADGTIPFTPANLVGKEKAQNDAKIAFYQNVYCEFWGIDFNVDLFKDKDVTKGLQDSLHVRYKEDTFAGLINFNYGGKPWDGGKIKYDAINLLDNAELDIIFKEFVDDGGSKQLYQGNKTDRKWTLYLKSLAAKAVLADAQNYSDNKKTLAALDEVVNKVKEAYNAAVTKKENKAAIALADSLVNEFLGKDIVAYVYAANDIDSKKVHPYSIWDGDLKYFRVIKSIGSTTPQEDFQTSFIYEGEYFLGGIQLAAAEAYIPDYAEKIQAWWDAEDDMEKATANLKEFEEILSEYVKEIADLDGYRKIGKYDDVDEVAEKVDKAWTKFLGKIENAIVKFENEKRSAEQSLAKLEAGYDPQQVAIEKAQGDLDKALAALEVAEARLAAAEAAYKQVLANHGITE